MNFPRVSGYTPVVHTTLTNKQCIVNSLQLLIPEVSNGGLVSSWGFHTLDVLHWYALLQMINHPTNAALDSPPHMLDKNIPPFSTPLENHQSTSPPLSQLPPHEPHPPRNHNETPPSYSPNYRHPSNISPNIASSAQI